MPNLPPNPEADAGVSVPQPLQTHCVQRWVDGQAGAPAQDVLIEETPVALEFNGITYATMLVTPSDLEDFARGFALTEGVVHSCQEIYGIDIKPTSDGIVLHVEIASARAQSVRQRKRAMAGRTGCGLCGVESLDQVLRPLKHVCNPPVISQSAVNRALTAMSRQQPLYQATGASHAAALASLDGTLIAVREDVGRHNALDKLIGATAVQSGGGMVVVSSRASFEMVQKTLAAGHVLLAAVSAPTAMAQRLASEHGLTLIGFARENKVTVYSGMHRVVA